MSFGRLAVDALKNIQLLFAQRPGVVLLTCQPIVKCLHCSLQTFFAAQQCQSFSTKLPPSMD
jgi:hypothetical protein